ncbi:MAG TPA: hypothetical protein VFB23_13745 [Candidatus Acidoferrales bacterium]|nr:hypothetical protein [Candidatus Acidoferrales bacterium]
MSQRHLNPAIMAGLLFALPVANLQAAGRQTGSERQPAKSGEQRTSSDFAPTVYDGWGRAVSRPASDRKSVPAPVRDISGTWEPAGGPLDGVQFNGSKNYQEDGKSDREPPYTEPGRKLWQDNKPSIGSRGVVPADSNDPVLICDPQGFPREDLFQLRTTQIVQTPLKVLILYEFDQIWRVIWTDGRELPKDPEPRWFGYSVGKWVDDYTFVVETTGLDERSWIDNVGRPHSDALRVEERFHRVDRDHLEWSVTVDDPKMYKEPWVALDKLRLYLQPANYDVREMICSPSEQRQYDSLIGNPQSEDK